MRIRSQSLHAYSSPLHPKRGAAPELGQPRALFAKERLFRELFNLSGDIALVVGNRGETFIDCNPRLTRLLGYTKKEVRACGPSRLFADPTGIRGFFQSVWAGKGSRSTQTSCLGKSGNAISARIHARLISGWGSHAALAVICPMELRKSQAPAEKELDDLSRLLQISSEAASSSPTLQHQFELWLKRICRLANFPVGHIRVLLQNLPGLSNTADIWHIAQNKGLEVLRLDPARIALPPEFHLRVAAGRVPEIVPDLTSQPQFRQPEIHAFNLKSAFAVPIVMGNEVMAISEFFSDHRLQYESLLLEAIHILGLNLGWAMHDRVLSLKMTKLQDDERRRLARELHDTVAQSLSVLLLDLEMVQEKAEAFAESAREALKRSMALARQSLQEIRTVSYLLHPPVLDALGLLPALRVFIEGFSRRSGIRILSEFPDSLPRMPDDWEMAVFRVVQEGLTNVQRHSRSSSAEVRLKTGSELATLQVVNEGASVPPLGSGGLAPEKVGVGIAGMRERLRVFGGDVHLFSREGKTVLEATVPLPELSRSSPQLPLGF